MTEPDTGGDRPHQRQGELTSAQFRQIGKNGLGDPDNAYVHGMDWFEGRLYCGMTRNSFKLLRLFPPIEPPALEPWPVEVPDSVEDLDMKGQLWRWTPETDSWEMAYRSPLIPGKHGRPAPRDLGYRGMTVFQGASDPKPCLYVSTMSTVLRGCAAHVLRSEDGLNFEPACEPGIGNDRISTFRELVHFDGYLYAPPAGEGIQFNSSRTGVLMRSRDPRPGNWEVACDLGFGDATNNGIFMMTEANGQLYAGTFNCFEGYQIWATPPCGDGPLQWRKVIEKGAYRGPTSEIAMAMVEFNGALYVGSSIQNGGYDRTNLVGPGSGEIIRIWPDDSWELLVGSPRETPLGTIYPRSGMGPGFDNIFAGYTWRMCVHDGWLYATTFDWSVFLQYAHRPSPAARRLLGALSYEQLASVGGGFEMWRTRDGVSWIPVTLNGMGNPFNYGGRTMVSTPKGLAVGTANVFGGSTPARLASRWTYVPNPDGGTEVYLGDPSQSSYVIPTPEDAAAETIAITGGNAEPARTLAAALRQAGYRVREVPFEETADTALDELEATFSEFVAGARIVVHLAESRGGQAGRDTLRAVNVSATHALLRACAATEGLQRFVFGSSVSVYEKCGDETAWPVHEAHMLHVDARDTTSDYGLSKIAGENLVHHYARRAGFEHTILRLSEVYGMEDATLDRLVGQTVADLDAHITQSAGSDPMPNAARQFLHLDDALEALARACFDPGAKDETFNVAGPDVATRSEIFRLARISAGRPRQQDLIPERNRVWRRYLQQFDLTRARSVLGFRPSVPITEGIHRLVDRPQSHRAHSAPE